MCIYSRYDEEISTSEIKTIRVNSFSNDFELLNDILYIFHKIKNVSSCIHFIFKASRLHVKLKQHQAT